MWGNRRKKNIATLTDMLTYRRVYQSKAEAAFVAKYIDSVKGMQRDMIGNRYIVVGGDKADVMFSCHVDTVHKAGADRQQVALKNGIYSVADNSNCLGADDAAGMYIALRMISAKVPGVYVFHAGEERGGIGSDWLQRNPPEWYSHIKAAIAFDRRGTKSIITEQCVGETASNAFADSLASVIALGHQKDDTGTFTDTANYAGDIAECTNISVGYEDEHRKSETLDCEYVLELADAMCSRWDSRKLEIVRKPGDFGTVYAAMHAKGFRRAGGKYDYLFSDKYYDVEHDVDGNKAPYKAPGIAYRADGTEIDWEDDIAEYEEDCLFDAVQEYPEAVVQLLTDYGISADEILDYANRTARRKA